MTETPVRAVVAPEITGRHPDSVAAVLVVEHIPNGPSGRDLALDELEAAVDDLENRLRSGWPACTTERLVIGDA